MVTTMTTTTMRRAQSSISSLGVIKKCMIVAICIASSAACGCLVYVEAFVVVTTSPIRARKGARFSVLSTIPSSSSTSSSSLSSLRKKQQQEGRRKIYANVQNINGNLFMSSSSSSENKETSSSSSSSYKWTSQTAALALPALVGMIADPLLSLVDTLFVSRLGSIPLAALGACTSIFHLAYNTFKATTTATTSLVASALAAVDTNNNTTSPSSMQAAKEEEARLVTSTSLKFGLLIGIFVTLSLLLFCNTTLAAMGVPSTSALHPPASSYIRLRSLAAPAVLLVTVAEGAFRGYADTTIPLIASAVAAVANLILDPIFMFSPTFKFFSGDGRRTITIGGGMGVGGAALATALSQYGAAAVYLYFLRKRKMLPQKKKLQKQQTQTQQPFKTTTTTTTTTNHHHHHLSQSKIILTIIASNIAMFTKQGSLLLGWAYATRKAATLGHDHVAAHQIALSLWMVFALIMDGVAVAAQVLMSTSWSVFVAARNKEEEEQEKDYEGADGQNEKMNGTIQTETNDKAPPPTTTSSSSIKNLSPRHEIRSLTKYMTKLSLFQGILCTTTLLFLSKFAIPILLPSSSSSSTSVQNHLAKILPHLSYQQILVSLTLVWESIAIGGNYFNLLAIGTCLSSVASVCCLNNANDIESIWSGGIVVLFLGRLITASIGVLDMYFGLFDFFVRERKRGRRRGKKRK